MLGFLGILVAVFEGEEDGGGEEWVGGANLALEVAFIGPVELLEVGAVDDKPGGVGVGLGDVAELGPGVFGAGGGVGFYGLLENLVEIGGFALFFAD